MNPELQALTQRVDELERQIAHLASLIAEHSDNDRTVVARSFVVEDAQGQRRAELGTTIPVGLGEEQPWLGLFDANGSVRACLGVHPEGPWLELYNVKGKVVAEISESQDGPRMALFDSNGSTRASLAVSEHGSAVYLFSSNGKRNLRLELPSSDQPALVIQDSDGDSRFFLSADGEKGPILAFLKGNEVIWRIPPA